MNLPLTCLAPLCALAMASSVVAATCGSGPNRAGCVGPNGAAIGHRPTAATMVREPVAAAPRVHCASGVYRAGCAGPNGAAVVHRPAAAAPAPAVHCANGVYRAGCAGPNGAVVAPKAH
ncbi:MAG TPA: hypothetical protein VGG92_12530 [Caulobacteraceae bacterium]